MASKLKHAVWWRELRRKRTDIEFTSRWFDCKHIDKEIEAQGHGSCALSEVAAQDVWIMDHRDVNAANVVIVYGEAGEHLRGALVEAGIALASGTKHVIVVGQHSDYGTWQFHPSCRRVDTLGEAFDLAKELYP